MFDFRKFCQDRRLADIAPGHHKHQRAGWINIACPFCTGDFGYHLGFNLRQGFFVCYRCGWHSVEQVIQALTGVKHQGIKNILQAYRLKDFDQSSETIIERPANLKLPDGCGPMTTRHKDYLASRKFDPDHLERLWGLLGTTHLGADRFRVIIPIQFNSQIVSYQGRDITGNQPKYKACNATNEVIPHKHILYGWDMTRGSQSVAVVMEGVTGVWRLGPGSLGTFGVKYTASQVRLLAQRFQKLYLFFDPDQAGRMAADKLSVELMGLGRDVEILEVSDNLDSGSLRQDDADQLMKGLLK